MARRSRYSAYHDRYPNYRLELTDDGILFMQCHTNGSSLVWDWRADDQMSDPFADIARDREIKVLTHTGTGDNDNANCVQAEPHPGLRCRLVQHGRRAGGLIA